MGDALGMLILAVGIMVLMASAQPSVSVGPKDSDGCASVKVTRFFEAMVIFETQHCGDEPLKLTVNGSQVSPNVEGEAQ